MNDKLPIQWWKVGGRPYGIHRWKDGGEKYEIRESDSETFRAIYNFLEISPLENSAAQISHLIKNKGAIQFESLSLSAAFKSNVNLERKGFKNG